jgi:hypothetical protein
MTAPHTRDARSSGPLTDLLARWDLLVARRRPSASGSKPHQWGRAGDGWWLHGTGWQHRLPMLVAASGAAASPCPSRSSGDLCLLVGDEDVLDPLFEGAGDSKRQWQARVEASGLDRVDGLAGDAEQIREVGLAPALNRTQLA